MDSFIVSRLLHRRALNTAKFYSCTGYRRISVRQLSAHYGWCTPSRCGEALAILYLSLSCCQGVSRQLVRLCDLLNSVRPHRGQRLAAFGVVRLLAQLRGFCLGSVMSCLLRRCRKLGRGGALLGPSATIGNSLGSFTSMGGSTVSLAPVLAGVVGRLNSRPLFDP
jgi:hypothetical protein